MFACLSITSNTPGNNLKLMKDLMNYDTILVAGESEDSHNVCNQYKALLKLNDQYCIQYVIEALQKVSAIGDIYIVGPTNSVPYIISPPLSRSSKVSIGQKTKISKCPLMEAQASLT